MYLIMDMHLLDFIVLYCELVIHQFLSYLSRLQNKAPPLAFEQCLFCCRSRAFSMHVLSIKLPGLQMLNPFGPLLLNPGWPLCAEVRLIRKLRTMINHSYPNGDESQPQDLYPPDQDSQYAPTLMSTYIFARSLYQ